MSIIVGFSAPINKKLGSEVIKWYLKTEYSHVFISWRSDSLQRDMVYHAANGMVHFINKENFLKNNIIIKEYIIPIDNNCKNKIIRKCVDLAAVDYGYDELLKIIIKDLCIKLSVKCEFINSKGFICSELVAEILEEVFVKKFNKSKYLLTPKDIEEFIKQNG